MSGADRGRRSLPHARVPARTGRPSGGRPAARTTMEDRKSMEPEPSTTFRLVRNDAGQVSIWAAGRPLPDGWADTGVSGSRAECLDDTRVRVAAGTPAQLAPDAGDEGTLVRLFAGTVARHGSRPAVTDDRQTLTYAELDRRSDALAARLVDRGVGADHTVAIYRRRGVDVFVAMLGVLKAGAAYVAVDSRYPDHRRDLMIEASGASVTLVEPGWADRLAHLATDVWEWHSEPVTGDPGGAAVPTPPTARSAACLLFTSGSSGAPKAVVLEHRNLVMFGANPALPALHPGDRTGQISSLSFDAFHYETWCSFAHGAEVVVLPAITDLIAADLQRELRRRRITAMLVPTMAVNQVIKEDRDAFAPLRILHTGGDVLLPASCRDVLGSAFTGRFFNLYGPTEATTACTAYEVRDTKEEAGTVPIGTAIEGATVYVLDGDLEPVEAGRTGELHVGGAGVARGYHGQPGLTAERFLPDPFGPPGSRMYATGDLARLGDDGLIEFVGRVDDQVKIRGYRVEPGEVERQLGRHPLIREIAVTATGEGQDKHLVAFVVLDEGVTPRELRSFATEVLPDFMVPASFVTLPEIPANDHGKRDWRRLGELLEEHRRRVEQHEPPRTEAERYLAALWEEMLGAERVGLTDDFFALGGHSLLAFRAQRRIRRDLRVALEFRDLLDNSVLGELASVVSRKQREGADR